MKIRENPYSGQDHWAYRLLACPQEEVEQRKQLASAMRIWQSAILYPEQLLANPHIEETRDTQKDRSIKLVKHLLFRVWAVWFTGGASGYDVKIRSHVFEKVRLRPRSAYGGGKASHVPRTVMQWDMAEAAQSVHLVCDRRMYNSVELKMHEFLPWLVKGTQEEQNFSMNMLFGDRRDAYSFGQYMLNRMGTMYPSDTLLRGLDRISIYDSIK